MRFGGAMICMIISSSLTAKLKNRVTKEQEMRGLVERKLEESERIRGMCLATMQTKPPYFI